MAEAKDLKSFQCGFESHPPYHTSGTTKCQKTPQTIQMPLAP